MLGSAQIGGSGGRLQPVRGFWPPVQGESARCTGWHPYPERRQQTQQWFAPERNAKPRPEPGFWVCGAGNRPHAGPQPQIALEAAGPRGLRKPACRASARGRHGPQIRTGPSGQHRRRWPCSRGCRGWSHACRAAGSPSGTCCGGTRSRPRHPRRRSCPSGLLRRQ